nr:hypothetical protein [Tanacetum cinerariifolium]
MDRGFLSQKGSRVGRESDETLNDANPLKEVVSPSVIDEHVAMEVKSPLVAQTYLVQSHVVEENVVVECPVVNTPDVGPYPPLPRHEANSAANAPGKPSYATATGKPNRKKVNVHTLFTLGGNGIDVVVPVESIHAISARFDNTAYGFFLGKKVAYPVVANYDDLSSIATKLGTPLMLDSYTSDMCMKSWGRSSYARVMIELRVDVELKDNIVVFGHIHEECPRNISAGEKKTVKKLSQTSRGVLVDPKIGFKPQKEYRTISKKPNASSSGNKKKSGGKLRLLDNDGNPLVPTDIIESNSVVEVIFDDTANLRISTSGKDRSEKGYGTNSLLEQ